MKRIIFLPMLIMLAAVTAFADPTFTTKTFDYKGEVESLVLNGCIDIKCVYAPEKAGTIEITATATGFEYLDLSYKGHTLKVSLKRNTPFKNICKEYKTATLYCSYALTDVQINGSGDIDIPSFDSKRDLTLVINGSGDIDVANLMVKSLVATVNGSGDIDIANSTITDLYCTVNGSGDMEIYGIAASNVTAEVNGSGDMELSGKTSSAVYSVSGSGTVQAHNLIAKEVVATATGSGDITYNSGADITKAGRKNNIHAR